MRRSLPIQISIPSPCSQNWDAMTPNERGRFCDLCQKTVIDFTTWSDTAMYNFFSKDHGHVCGRFLSTQLDRPINIPYQPHSRLYRITVALGLTLMFTQAPHLLAQNKSPKTEQTSTQWQSGYYSNGAGELRGQVLDEKKEPMINATIQAYHDGILKGGIVTDYDGNYIIKPLDAGTYDLVVLYAGYDSVKITGIPLISGQATEQNIQMKRKQGTLNSVIVVGYKVGLVDHESRSKTIKREEIIPMVTGGPTDLVSTSVGAYQQKRGSDINIGGSRSIEMQKPQPDSNNVLPGKRIIPRDEINQMPH